MSLSLLLFVVVSLSGCVSGRGIIWKRARDPMAGAPCLKNVSNPSIEEVVAHLNQNTDRIHSWQAKKVKIRVDKYSFNGMLAVEKDRKFRLQVMSMRGKEVDLGSNSDRFWVWAREMDPGFVTCRHENMDAARHQIGIPFEPDWLLQTLGVAPLPTTGVTIETDPEYEQARLVEQIVTAHGLPLRRVVLVDLKKGIVIEHSLYSNDATRLAQAKLDDHRLDPASGAVLAHQIRLDWPQTKMTLTMDLGEVQINPSSIPVDCWDLPEFPHTQVVHLDAKMQRPSIAGEQSSPSTDRLVPVETFRSHESHNFLRGDDYLNEEHVEVVDDDVTDDSFQTVEADSEDEEKEDRYREFRDIARESESSPY
ncbi:hypothetical protein [Schlesneria sp.]|uniref:hypothetical protein n=1 Tax=Schlesneria sp. TaxID=2762018 RepID=UPI002EE7C672